MMQAYFTLFEKQIPIYGIAFYAGIAVAALAAVLILRRKGQIPTYDLVYSAVYTMIGAMIGAKLLFILVSIRDIMALHLPWYALIKGGFVFYGGFLGGILGLFLYAKQFHIPFGNFVDIYAAVLPLGHGIGRIGCHFAGCCYGIPYDGIGAVVYHETPGNTPLGVALLPVQLIESVLLFLLFLLLTVLYFKQKQKGVVCYVYIGCYAVLRFVLEFFRGDGVRGIWLGLSTAQWISLLLMIGLVVCILTHIRKMKKQSLVA